MKNRKIISHKYSITIVAIIAMAIAFCYYLFIFVPAQEKNIKERNFRVLDKIASTINDNLESFRKKAQLAVKTNAYYASRIAKFKELQKRNNDEEYKKKLDKYIRLFETRILSTAEMEERYGVSIFYRDSLGGRTTRLYNTAYDELKRSHPILVSDKYVPEESDQPEVRYWFSVDARTMVEPHMREDVFKHCALFSEKDILFSTFSSGLKIDNIDTLLQSENGIFSSTVKTVQISGSEYMAFVHPITLGEEPLILCGFMPRSAYHKEKMSLESNVVLFAILILFIVILGFPFYKFALMSTSERMSIGDVLFAAGSLVLGASILVLVFLGLNNYWSNDRAGSEKELQDMSSLVSERFVREIDSAYKQLSHYDALIGKIGFDVTNINTDPHFYEDDFEIEQDMEDSLKKDSSLVRSLRARSYKNFKMVYWMNEDGDQLFKWTNESEISGKISLNDRVYFKSIISGNPWTLPRKKDTAEFILETVYSSTTGTITTAISKKSAQVIAVKNAQGDTIRIDTTRVVALTTDMNSVTDPILPLGYGYCIIDEKGNVLFHSDKTRNLKENFIQECTDTTELRSSIYGRDARYLKEKYQGKYYRMFIRPVDKLPLFIVTFLENDYEKTKDAEILSFTLTLILSYFLFICLLVALMLIVSRKQSKLKTRKFPFEWLWPRESRKENYFTALLFQIVLIILVLVFTDPARPLYSFFLFLLTSVYTLIITDLLIKRYTFALIRSKKETWVFMVLGLLILIVLNISAAQKLDSMLYILLFQVCVLFIVPALLFIRRRIHKMKNGRFSGLPSYRTSYVLLMLSWLTLTSILPSVIFYDISHRQEVQFLVRHRQLDMAKQLNKRSDLDTNLRYLTSGNRNNNKIYVSFFNQTRILKEYALPVTSDDPARESELFAKLISIFRPSFNDISATSSSLAGGSAADGAWRWIVTDDEVILKFKDVQKSKNNSVDSLFIVSDKNGALNKPMVGWGHFSLFMLTLWGILFFLIRFTVRKAFLIDLFTNKDLLQLENSLLNDREVNRNLFIVGLPYSAKSRYVDARFAEGVQRYTLDLVYARDETAWQKKISEACDERNKLVILDHFEYDCENSETNRKKLLVVEQLLQFPGKRIVIISTIHPWALLKEGKLNEQENICDADRWTKLMGGFIKIYYPLQGYETAERGTTERNRSLVDKECDNGLFLQSLKPVIEKHIAEKHAAGIKINKEEIILSIQSMAHTYYHSLWASFKKEERYLIFDLAQDGLANSRNIDIIAGLIKSGVLIYDGSLKVMNESFRNFVLTQIKPDEVLSLEKEANETGYWNQLKKPLVVILVMVGLFIFSTQQESYNNVITLIASFTAGIPILMRVFSVFSSAGSEQQKSKE